MSAERSSGKFSDRVLLLGEGDQVCKKKGDQVVPTQYLLVDKYRLGIEQR